MRKKKIADNPSAKQLLDIAKAASDMGNVFKTFPAIGAMFPKIAEAIEQLGDLQEKTQILHYPDQFNELFLQYGWVAYESMSIDVLRRAIALGNQGKIEEAEEILSNCYSEENLKWLLMRFMGHREFHKRLRIAELARDDYLAGRYHACIPVLLLLADGLVSDISKHVGLFAESVDMAAHDSIAAHESGLKELLRIIGVGRTKTNQERISIPYRNGILHGRELAYDTKLVAAKCWTLLFAVRDWAGALADGKEESANEMAPSLIDSIRSYADAKRYSERISSWLPRPNPIPLGGISHDRVGDLVPGTPEKSAADFLVDWSNARYGPMSAHLVDYVQGHPGKKAGNAKKDFGGFELKSFLILSVIDETPAISRIHVKLYCSSQGLLHEADVIIGAIYLDENADILLRGEPGGVWRIFQNSFSKILYKS